MGDRADEPVGEFEPTVAVGDAGSGSALSLDPSGDPRGDGHDPELALAPGARFGRYRLGARLGAGAMGVVWAARDTKLDRQVAIKVVHPAFARVPDAKARLLREARAMAQVSHRAVVAVHDAGEAGGQLFLAMELVEGTTLGRMIRERGPGALRDWRRWLGLLVEAGGGLAAAHAAGVVHRDFKPDNVLVGNDGRACVVDFGVAELSAASWIAGEADLDPASAELSAVDLTMTGALLGTPAYMSPEQLRSKDADARSDQFGFCVALHEALYGVRPFALPPRADADGVRLLIHTIETRQLVAIPAGSAVPRWVRDVVLRGLAPDPAQRWPDVPALLAALRPPRRWRAPIAIAGAAMIAALAAVIAVARGGPAPAPAPAPVVAAPAPRVEARALFRVPMRPSIALSPDGQRIAVASAERLVVRGFGSGPIVQFGHFDGQAISRIEFADAERLRIALTGSHPEVVVWNLTSDRIESHQPIRDGATWLGTVVGGALLVRAVGDGFELVVDDGGAGRVIARGADRLEISAISPDQRRVAYVDPLTYAGRPVVVDVATGARRVGAAMVELSALSWRDADHLWLATGTTTQPTIYDAAVAADHVGPPQQRYRQERGWFGQIASVPGRTVFVDSANSFRAKMVTRAGSVQDLDPELIGAGMAWLDDGGWLLWNHTTGDLGPDDDAPERRLHVAIDGEPGNATRAGDVAIVAMRKPGGRELVAVSLAERRRRWTLPVGVAALARCAGDAREPCFVVTQPEGQPARVLRLAPATGDFGDEVAHAAAIQDIAVSPDGRELLICDGSSVLRAVTLASGQARALEVPMTNTRGVAYDPAGGFLVAGTAAPVSYQILQIDGARRTSLLQSESEILFMPRAAPDGHAVLVMGRLFMPELYELVAPSGP